MKKIFFIILILWVSASGTNAQSYSVNKHNYDYHLYQWQQGDRYIPALSGFCSFVVPGLGQMLDGEVPRGLAFLGGYTGCILAVGTGEILLIGSIFGGMEGENTGYKPSLGVALIYLGIAGIVAVDIWSVVDAVKVAKVNNMYYRDQRKTKVVLEVLPCVEPVALNNRLTVPVGLTLKVSF